jgi:hypothetical protein
MFVVGYRLVDVAPNLAKEWHPRKNAPLELEKITSGSGKKVWWIGKCGHEFQAQVGNRVNLNSGCPVCAGKLILIGVNDLDKTHPLIASEFHPSKNNPLTSQQVTAGSNKKVWWVGKDCGHEWEARVLARTSSNSGCSVCDGKTILAGFNDLSTKFPHVATQWHPTRNGDILPTAVSGTSHAKVWWLDNECGHEWETSIGNRTAKGNNCPICSSHRVLPGYNDLATAHPVIALDWHPYKNESLTPHDVTSQSNQKVWWVGETCGHEWQMVVSNRTVSKQNCPVCSNQQIVAGFNDLQTFSKLLADQWHPNKNGELLPSQIGPQSSRKVWWLGDCKHEWESTVASRARSTNTLCPACTKVNLLQGVNDLSTTHPDLLAEWHPTKNTVMPSEITAGSGQNMWWSCKEGHDWKTTVRNRASLGYGCPTCSGKITLIGFNDLATTQPLLASQWHPTNNNDLTPNMVTIGSGRKVWWLCDKGHEWQAIIADRATHHKTNCPECNANNWISKAEHEIASFLGDLGLTVIQSDRKILQGIEMDIYVPERKFAIEYNGIYWHTENKGKGKYYHYDKWLAAKNAGIQLVQIWEDEWNKNPEQVKTMLLHKLGMSSQEKVFARKTIIQRLSKADVETFLNANHIQGSAVGSYYLGLIEKDTQEIVSVIVLKKDVNNSLNIVRYATSKNVVGGFTKLLKYAERNFAPSSFMTFSDNCVSDGGLYEKNGFIADKELPPDYRYVVNGNREHKFGYRLKRFKNAPTLQWEDGLTERELAQLNNIPRIWDAGKIRWVKKVIGN